MGDGPVVQGVMAINKPSTISSADALRALQHHFTPSSLFAPLLAHTLATERAKPFQQRKKRQKHLLKQVKLGHGGTLDPLATGVLITGVGAGTKELSGFLGCKKSYETVVLFGVASDTYDVLGRVVLSKDWAGVSRDSVEQALAKFRGKVMQRPPIYSARWVNGERMYDLARRGETVPDEVLEEREVTVDEMELVEFYPEGEHEFVMRTGEELGTTVAGRRDGPRRGQKRKRDREREPDGHEPPVKTAKDDVGGNNELGSQTNEISPTVEEATKVDAQDISVEKPVMTGALPAEEESVGSSKTTQSDETSQSVKLGPAARIKMTVSSGFYVRSLCHDLGRELGSAALMAELVRTKQGDFELGKNVLEYEDLEKGEEVWGPKVKHFLEEWQQMLSTKDIK